MKQIYFLFFSYFYSFLFLFFIFTCESYFELRATITASRKDFQLKCSVSLSECHLCSLPSTDVFYRSKLEILQFMCSHNQGFLFLLRDPLGRCQWCCSMSVVAPYLQQQRYIYYDLLLQSQRRLKESCGMHLIRNCMHLCHKRMNAKDSGNPRKLSHT